MTKAGTILGREPVVLQTAVFALINLLVAFDVVHWTALQIGTVNAIVAAILGVIVRQVVTPLVDPKKKIDGQMVPLTPETKV